MSIGYGFRLTIQDARSQYIELAGSPIYDIVIAIGASQEGDVANVSFGVVALAQGCISIDINVPVFGVAKVGRANGLSLAFLSTLTSILALALFALPKKAEA